MGTIRAYNLEGEFLSQQLRKVATNKRMRIAREGLENWLAMRLSFLIFFINMPAIAYSLLSEDRTASTVGVLLAYAMNLSANAVDVTLW